MLTIICKTHLVHKECQAVHGNFGEFGPHVLKLHTLYIHSLCQLSSFQQYKKSGVYFRTILGQLLQLKYMYH